MGKINQIDSVKKALDLEISIANIEEELSRPIPEPPVRTIIERVYPNIVPTIKFNWIKAFAPLAAGFVAMALVGTIHALHRHSFVLILVTLGFFLSIVWIPVYYFAIHRRARKAEIEKIRNSDEYRSYCAHADAEFDKMQYDADMNYNNQLYKYEQEVLPQFQERFKICEEELKVASESLAKLYEETKVVPSQYRTIDALQYIYDMVTTSDFDIRYAIEDYNRFVLRRLSEAQLHELQVTTQLAHEQRDLLEEMGDTAKKARRDANIAQAAGFLQRRSIGKRLAGLRKK